MESDLTNQIALHIFNNIGVISPMKVSVQNKKFLLNQTIDLEDDKILKLWGAEVDLGGSKLRMLLTELTDSDPDKEFVLIVKLENCPSYGCYISLNENEPRDGKIYFSVEEDNWAETNTFLQATFLGGMEQLKDVLSNWNKVSIEDDLVESMKSLIKVIFEFEDEE